MPITDTEIESLVRDKYRKTAIKPSQTVINEEIEELKKLRDEKEKNKLIIKN